MTGVLGKKVLVKSVPGWTFTVLFIYNFVFHNGKDLHDHMIFRGWGDPIGRLVPKSFGDSGTSNDTKLRGDKDVGKIEGRGRYLNLNEYFYGVLWREFKIALELK